MAADDRAAAGGPDRRAPPRSCLFAVRLWTEETAGGQEFRGSVRDVMSGAFRGFRDWSDLVAFMTGRMQEAGSARPSHTEGGPGWSLEKR